MMQLLSKIGNGLRMFASDLEGTVDFVRSPRSVLLTVTSRLLMASLDDDQRARYAIWRAVKLKKEIVRRVS